MSLEDEVQRLMDVGVKATPASVRALTEGPQSLDDPIGDIVMPMLAANREAILRIAREIDEVEAYRARTRIRASSVMATVANRFGQLLRDPPRPPSVRVGRHALVHHARGNQTLLGG